MNPLHPLNPMNPVSPVSPYGMYSDLYDKGDKADRTIEHAPKAIEKLDTAPDLGALVIPIGLSVLVGVLVATAVTRILKP